MQGAREGRPGLWALAFCPLNRGVGVCWGGGVLVPVRSPGCPVPCLLDVLQCVGRMLGGECGMLGLVPAIAARSPFGAHPFRCRRASHAVSPVHDIGRVPSTAPDAAAASPQGRGVADGALPSDTGGALSNFGFPGFGRPNPPTHPKERHAPPPPFGEIPALSPKPGEDQTNPPAAVGDRGRGSLDPARHQAAAAPGMASIGPSTIPWGRIPECCPAAGGAAFLRVLHLVWPVDYAMGTQTSLALRSRCDP